MTKLKLAGQFWRTTVNVDGVLYRSKTPAGEADDVNEATLLYADLDFAEFQAARCAVT